MDDFNGSILDTRSDQSKSYDIVWTDLVSNEALANDLVKISGGNTWNGGAASENILPSGEDGWLEMTAKETGAGKEFAMIKGIRGQVMVLYDFLYDGYLHLTNGHLQ